MDTPADANAITPAPASSPTPPAPAHPSTPGPVGAGDGFDLETHRIPGLSAYYIPDFVTAEEEEYLLRKVDSAPKAKWRTLNGRRLQVWGGELTPANALLPQPLPAWLTSHPDLLPRIGRTGIFRGTKQGVPNHVIVNEYLPGQGIFAHKDGPAYFPAVATLTLSSHAVFHYHAPLSSAPALSLLLEPRSLVVTTGELYADYAHSIDAVEADELGAFELRNGGMLGGMWREKVGRCEVVRREKRVSLTCRVVERIVKGVLPMGRSR